jgi:hypothetical protein
MMVLGVVVNEVVTSHGESLLLREGSGCLWMLEHEQDEDLGRMFRLFNRVKGQELIERMAAALQQHVEAQVGWIPLRGCGLV